MKILLINPVITTDKERLIFPLNLVFLASGIKQYAKNVDIQLLDITFERFCNNTTENISLQEVQEKYIELIWRQKGSFDIVGISGLCDNFHLTIAAAEFIKRKFCTPIVIGGPHATFIPDEILKTFPFADFVIKHDGIYPLIELCSALRKKNTLSKTPNLSYRLKNGKIKHNTIIKSPPFGILNTKPDYNMLPMKKYFEINPNMAIPVLTGAGCPYNCSFCSTSAMWHRNYKTISPKKISETISKLKSDFPNAQYSFVHDNLLFDKNFASKLCDKLKNIEIKWGCSSRLEHIMQESFIKKLCHSGCKAVFIGLETATRKMQKIINKNIEIKYVLPITKKLIKNKVKPIFSFVTGFDKESDTDRNKTIKLAFKLKTLGAERVNIHHLSPLPGTEFYEKKMILSGNKNDFLSPSLVTKKSEQKLILENPKIFSSLWQIKDNPKNTVLLPSATKKIDIYLAKHYRSFNYLFSRTKILPSNLFSVFQKNILDKNFPNTVKKFLNFKEFKIFKEIFDYETLLNLFSCSAENPNKKSKKIGNRNAKKISKKIMLLKSRINLPDFLKSEIKKKTRLSSKNTYLCIVYIENKVQTYLIKKEFYNSLIGLSKTSKTTLKKSAETLFQKTSKKIIKEPLGQLLKAEIF